MKIKKTIACSLRLRYTIKPPYSKFDFIIITIVIHNQFKGGLRIHKLVYKTKTNCIYKCVTSLKVN